jgi:DNA-binding FrmR family transcriptional regulator
MVEEGRDCREILHQIAAIKAAAHSLGTAVLEHYVLTCLYHPPASLTSEESLEVVREAIRKIAL